LIEATYTSSLASIGLNKPDVLAETGFLFLATMTLTLITYTCVAKPSCLLILATHTNLDDDQPKQTQVIEQKPTVDARMSADLAFQLPVLLKTWLQNLILTSKKTRIKLRCSNRDNYLLGTHTPPTTCTPLLSK